MKTNTRKAGKKTHEGGPAFSTSPEKELRRAVMCCLLWENTFYENGVDIADRIKGLVKICDTEFVSNLAIECRSEFYLRHVPLLLCVELARTSRLKAATLTEVIQRPDEITEFLSLYWLDGKCRLANQVKKGLAGAFNKFNEYSLAKYNRKADITLRDVMFLTHPKPNNQEQADLFQRLANNELATPDTWEVAISATSDKTGEWTRLLKENKLGGLALIRNLRNMQEAGVDRKLIRDAITNMSTNKILPFRFIAAARHAPGMEDVLETAMLGSLQNHDKLQGTTILLVDNSYSMYGTPISHRSELDRKDAAGALSILLKEICEDTIIVSFSTDSKEVANRRGFGLAEAIQSATNKNGTYLGAAIKACENIPHDRIIVITDEQSHDTVGKPYTDKAYMLNVAGYKNEVGYGDWMKINGWSENVVNFILNHEISQLD